MNTTEDSDSIIWTKRKEWGMAGFVHRATVTVGDVVYHFVIDRPDGGVWTARGWKDGTFFFYRDNRWTTILTGMKHEVARTVDELRTAAKGGTA